jgi:flagellar basal-body rod protein FlgC
MLPNPPVKPVRPAGALDHIFGGMRIAESGMTAESFRVHVMAQNIANAETTRTSEGGPYQRRVVDLEAVAGAQSSAALSIGGGAAGLTGRSATEGGVRVSGVRRDATPGQLIYDPGHPDADKSGYVRMPNVDAIKELMDMQDARGSFDANTTVFSALSSMLRKAVKI